MGHARILPTGLTPVLCCENEPSEARKTFTAEVRDPYATNHRSNAKHTKYAKPIHPISDGSASCIPIGLAFDQNTTLSVPSRISRISRFIICGFMTFCGNGRGLHIRIHSRPFASIRVHSRFRFSRTEAYAWIGAIQVLLAFVLTPFRVRPKR